MEAIKRIGLGAAGLLLFFFCTSSFALDKGIYVTQSSLENTNTLQYFIKRAKEVGINTFIVDLHQTSKRYERNIQRLHDHGIRYVARIVVFPHGATRAQMHSEDYWRKRYRLMQHAINLGAHEIQLD